MNNFNIKDQSIKSVKGFYLFNDIMLKVASYNQYTSDLITSKNCDNVGIWSPVDLVVREYLNNECSSSTGFLGIDQDLAIFCFNFIKNNINYFKDNDLISRDGENNFGVSLWENYEL